MAKTADLTNPTFVLEGFKTADSNSYCAKKIGRSITDIAKAGKKLDARLHATAFAVMDRAAAHNDCSLAAPLVAAMPRGARRNDMIAWFAAFSNVRIKLDKDSGTFKAGLVSSKAKDFRDAGALADGLRDAWAKPFYSVEEAERASNPFDDKRFAAAVARLIKQAEEATSGLSADTQAALADLKAINAKLTPAA
ncbi:hypothetical protein [Sphingomonas sp.]